MGRWRQLAGGLVLGNQRVDHTGIFAVDARDAAVLFQLLQCIEQILIADHHGGIGHVHFKGWYSGCKHGRNFVLDAVVPVVDRHVEAVVAA